jgi:hypothetical protein
MNHLIWYVHKSLPFIISIFLRAKTLKTEAIHWTYNFLIPAFIAMFSLFLVFEMYSDFKFGPEELTNAK